MSADSDFVNRLAARTAAQAIRLKDADPVRAAESQEVADRLIAIAKNYDRMLDLTTAMPRSLGSVSDLPPELIAELASVKVDELEDQIVSVINAYGGTANIDEILVGLFRKCGVVQTRKFMLNKLYRMMKAGLLYGVEGRKGLYSTEEQVKSEPFGQDPYEPIINGNSISEIDEDEIPF